jgi:hypothetical protein
MCVSVYACMCLCARVQDEYETLGTMAGGRHPAHALLAGMAGDVELSTVDRPPLLLSPADRLRRVQRDIAEVVAELRRREQRGQEQQGQGDS